MEQASNDNSRLTDECLDALRKAKTALGAYLAWQKAETDWRLLDVAAEIIRPASRAFTRAQDAWDAHPQSASNTARVQSAANRYYKKLCEVLERWGSHAER